jgi:predicted phosphoribosyltransferase
MPSFTHRRAAGQALAKRLAALGALPHPIVLALPRGGVPVAFEVAALLRAPLDVLVVRKLGIPFHEEFAFGAIASGGMTVLDPDLIAEVRVPADKVDAVIERERRELIRREHLYRGWRPFPDLAGATVILVDDGLATGSTMRAAVEAVRTRHPASVIVAAPVASRQAATSLMEVADACVIVIVPESFHAVGLWYDDFSETSDDEVLALLARARGRQTLEVAS